MAFPKTNVDSAVDTFISNWNIEFPQHPLTLSNIKKPHQLIESLFVIFDRLCIDKEAIIVPPPQTNRDEHTVYYWDLIPVINMIRVSNHILSETPVIQITLCLSDFLHPTVSFTKNILVIFLNFMVFQDDILKEIEPKELELFSQRDKIQELENKKNKLLELLNDQAVEKAKRGERLEKIDQQIIQLEVELKQEEEINLKENELLEAAMNEWQQVQKVLEQKKAQLDSLLADVARKRALIVCDADDIKAQVEQVAKKVKEADEKLNLLKEALAQKESILKNLQTIKPTLDLANNLPHDIIKLSENLRSSEDDGDVDDSLETINAELAELQAQLTKIKATHDKVAQKRQESLTRRQEKGMLAQNALQESELKELEYAERSKKSLQRTQENKDMIIKYRDRKEKCMVELTSIKVDFEIQLKTLEEGLLKKLMETEKTVEKKFTM